MLRAKENCKSHIPYKGTEIYDNDDDDDYAIYQLVPTLNLIVYIMIFPKIRDSYTKIGQEVTQNKFLFRDIP